MDTGPHTRLEERVAQSIAGLHIRYFMGYGVITLFFTGLVFLAGRMFF